MSQDAFQKTSVPISTSLSFILNRGQQGSSSTTNVIVIAMILALGALFGFLYIKQTDLQQQIAINKEATTTLEHDMEHRMRDLDADLRELMDQKTTNLENKLSDMLEKYHADVMQLKDRMDAENMDGLDSLMDDSKMDSPSVSPAPSTPVIEPSSPSTQTNAK
jgi:C4-dicarboxylate-specific signal transduction histidine kinase